MKRILPLTMLLLILVSTSANAWFFFFLPGSVTSKIADAVTGSEGENCVGLATKVGDRIRLPTGETTTVKSLSGTSSRCTQPEHPIRALLEPSNSSNTGNSITFNSKAGIDLPDGWAPVEITEQIKGKGYFFYALNRTIDAGLLMSAAKRQEITDMPEFAKTRRASQMAALTDGHQSEIEQLQVNGMPAWRFEVHGKIPKTDKDFTYLVTLVDGGTETVEIVTYMYTARFPDHKTELSNLAFYIKGLNAELAPVVVAPELPQSAPVVVAPELPQSAPVVVAPELPQSAHIVVAPETPQPNGSAATRLSNLKKLRQDGLITQKEFERKKQEILKGL